MKITTEHVLNGSILVEVAAPHELLFDSLSLDYFELLMKWFMRGITGEELEPKFKKRYDALVRLQSEAFIAFIGPIYVANNKHLPYTTEGDVMRAYDDAKNGMWYPWTYVEILQGINGDWYQNVSMYWSRMNESSQCFVACLAKAIIDKLPTPLEA